MAQNSRMSVAVHVLTLLALNKGKPMTSGQIAESVNTNPVVVRRLMGRLRAIRVVRSRGGAGGGWLLVRDADSVTLQDLRTAVEMKSLFELHRRKPNVGCPVGRNIQAVLATVYRKAEEAVDKELAKTTIGTVLSSVQARARREQHAGEMP